jgi:hypothetical protein
MGRLPAVLMEEVKNCGSMAERSENIRLRKRSLSLGMSSGESCSAAVSISIYSEAGGFVMLRTAYRKGSIIKSC